MQRLLLIIQCLVLMVCRSWGQVVINEIYAGGAYLESDISDELGDQGRLGAIRDRLVMGDDQKALWRIGDVGYWDSLGKDKVDWLELRNLGNASVDLSGWSLVDGGAAWSLPQGAMIEAHGFLVVVASGDSTAEPTPVGYRAALKLTSGGERLWLLNKKGEVVDKFGGEAYPKQVNGWVYARAGDDLDVLGYTKEASPGEANPMSNALVKGLADAPRVSPEGGFYETSVEVNIAHPDRSCVKIFYTLDGSTPSPTNGQLLSGDAVRVDAVPSSKRRQGVVLRVVAVGKDRLHSAVVTHTYLVQLNPVLMRLPAVSLAGDRRITFTNPLGIMAISGGSFEFITWRPQKDGDYHFPTQRGRAYERPVSVELLESPTRIEGQPRWHQDGGIRVAGGNVARSQLQFFAFDENPWLSLPTEKASYNLFFRKAYSSPPLGFTVPPGAVRYSQWRLRAGPSKPRETWILDELARRLFQEMGQSSAVGSFRTLFVNGAYKGYYNLVPRPREAFFRANAGRKAAWDVISGGLLEDGTIEAWENLRKTLGEDLSSPSHYSELRQQLDIVNFIDYLILNIYGDTWDWPSHNYIAAKERTENGRWQFHVWDAEGFFGGGPLRLVDRDTMKEVFAEGGTMIPFAYRQLIRSGEFRTLFAKRLQRHFFDPDGALQEANVLKHATSLKDQIGPLMAYSGDGEPSLRRVRNWAKLRPKALFGEGKCFQEAGLWPVAKD